MTGTEKLLLLPRNIFRNGSGDEYKERMRKRLEEDMEFFKASKEEGGFGICLDLLKIGSRIK